MSANNANTPVRIGIIGAGNIVKTRHLPGLAGIPGVEVVAVCNRSRESSQAVAGEWNIPHVEDTPEALLARDDINAVVIGTPPYRHRDLTLAALDAGKHVFCQARMSRDVAEARDMLKAAQAHPGLVTMLCPAPHVQPGQAFVERLLREGTLGDLRLVRLQHMTDSALSPEAPYHWRMDKSLSGYNLMTLGMYAEIMQRWVGKARTVNATGTRFVDDRLDAASGKRLPVHAPETLAVSGLLENGAHYVYTFTAVAAHGPTDQFEIYGTRGTLTYDVPNHVIRLGLVGGASTTRVGKVMAKEPPPVIEIPQAERGDWRVEEEFVSAIRNGTPVFPNFADGEAYMEFVEAAAHALERGATVTLPL